MKYKHSAWMMAGVIAIVASVQADPVTVPGYSFETPSVLGRPFDFQDNSGLADGSAIPEGVGWYYLGGFIQSGSPVGVQVSSSSGLTDAPDGTQSLYVNNGSWAGSEALGAITADTTYTLDLWHGNRTGFPQTSGFTVALAYGSTAGDTALTDGSQWLASVHYNLDDPGTATAGNWAELAPLTYSTTGTGAELGQQLFVLLGADANVDSFAQQVNFDYVRLDASAVPEPTTFALALVGLGLFAACRRRF